MTNWFISMLGNLWVCSSVLYNQMSTSPEFNIRWHRRWWKDVRNKHHTLYQLLDYYLFETGGFLCLLLPLTLFCAFFLSLLFFGWGKSVFGEMTIVCNSKDLEKQLLMREWESGQKNKPGQSCHTQRVTLKTTNAAEFSLLIDPINKLKILCPCFLN